MPKIKKKLLIFISVILFIDILIGIFIFKSRSFARLAIWNIIESNKQTDFYWHLKDAPKYSYFDEVNPKLEFFRNEISGVIKDKNNNLEQILIIADYVMNLSNSKKPYSNRLSWGSPYDILKQLRQGKQGTCFHYNILFSTYLASIGIKSRLWALEGDDGLGRFGHTVTEVYLEDLNKWIMTDVTKKMFFKDNNQALSVLELRERLLNEKILDASLSIYRRLLKMVFLRTANDFFNKYDAKIRYGRLYKLEKIFDRFPSDIRRGLNYLLGRKDYLIHYVDEFDKSLKPKIILAKAIFYFFMISLIIIFFVSLFSVRYLRAFFERR